MLGDAELFEAAVAAEPDSGFDTLPPDLLDRAVAITLDCATADEIADAFASGFGDDALPPQTSADVAVCMGSSLTDGADDRVDAMVGLVQLGDDLRPDEDQTEAVVDLLARCAGSEVVREVIAGVAIDDPDLGDALDAECLERETGSPEFARDFWQITVSNAEVPEFDDIPDADKVVIIGPVWECISFGTAVAAAASQDGVVLDQATIDCIDESVDNDELLDAFIDDREPEGVDAAVAACL